MICHTNGNHKRAGVAILLPDKIDFETRNLIRQGSTFPISKRVIRSAIYKLYLTREHQNTGSKK